MPLIGEYAPSAWPDARDQVKLYEETDGAQGNLLMGLPVVIITTTGKATGSLRKTPVMRVEHGAPTPPSHRWAEPRAIPGGTRT